MLYFDWLTNKETFQSPSTDCLWLFLSYWSKFTITAIIYFEFLLALPIQVALSYNRETFLFEIILWLGKWQLLQVIHKGFCSIQVECIYDSVMCIASVISILIICNITSTRRAPIEDFTSWWQMCCALTSYLCPSTYLLIARYTLQVEALKRFVKQVHVNANRSAAGSSNKNLLQSPSLRQFFDSWHRHTMISEILLLLHPVASFCIFATYRDQSWTFSQERRMICLNLLPVSGPMQCHVNTPLEPTACHVIELRLSCGAVLLLSICDAI